MKNSAWLFPGQGSQSVGLCADLYAHSSAVKAVFDEADSVLGFSLRTLIFEGPLDELTLTQNAQPAILTTGIALLTALKEKLPTLPAPLFAAGHSLGEFSALVAAGALSFSDAIKLVRLRGEAMGRATKPGVGTMSAIIALSDEDVATLCADVSKATGEIVAPANYNAKGQVVIAGTTKAVAAAEKLADERGGKPIPINVSAPFHCELMNPAKEELMNAIENIAISQLAFPVVSNVTALPHENASLKELLIKQVTMPVKWSKTCEYLEKEAVTRAIEFGPGKILSNLMKRNAKSINMISVFDLASLDAACTAFSKE